MNTEESKNNIESKESNTIKENKKVAKRNFFVRNVLKEVKEQETKFESKHGHKVSRAYHNIIKKRAAKKVMRKLALYALVGSLAIGGYAGTKLLDSGDNTRQEESIIKDEGSKFREELSNLNNYDKDLKRNAKEKVESLDKDQTLYYIKQIYAEDYNKNNEEQIEVENVRFEKNSTDNKEIALYRDKAKNGDEIIRIIVSSNNDKARQDGLIAINGVCLSAITKDGEGYKKERAMFYNGQYIQVYDQNEEVSEYQDNTLSELGDVVRTGIDRWSTMENTNVDYSNEITYKERFIDAIYKYDTSKQYGIINEQEIPNKATIEQPDKSHGEER